MHRSATRFLVLLIIGVLVSTAIRSSQQGAVRAQDSDPEATISALQTEVADLKTQVAEANGGAEAEGTPAPTEGEIQLGTLFGDAGQYLPAGEPGKIDVILVGQPNRSTIPVVLRNNTEEDVYLRGVLGYGRDSSGALVRTSEVGSVAPSLLKAGAVAVAALYFGSEDLPAGLTYEFEPETKPADENTYRQDLEITEAMDNGKGIVGMAENTSNFEVSGPISVVGVCFDDAGEITGVVEAFGAKNELAPGEKTPFEARYYSKITCEHFLIGAAGWTGM